MKEETVEKLFGNFEFVTIAEQDGPNESKLTFVSVNGYLAVVQEWKGNAGFELYVASRQNSLSAARRQIGLDDEPPF